MSKEAFALGNSWLVTEFISSDNKAIYQEQQHPAAMLKMFSFSQINNGYRQPRSQPNQRGWKCRRRIFSVPLEREKKIITNGRMPNQPLPLNDFRVMIREIPETQEGKKRDGVKPQQNIIIHLIKI